MHHSDIEVDVVDVPEGRRAINQQTVDQLAESMAKIGLQNPIAVWSPDDFTADLVTGHHRLLAAKKLGWKKITCIRLSNGDGPLRELWEIDENLIRHDLSAAERAGMLKRREKIFKEFQSSVGGTSCPTKPQHQKAFAADTSEKTGQSKKDINRHISRAGAIPEIAEVVGTSLDKGVELDALKEMPVEERRELINRAKAGEKVTARTNIVTLDPGYHKLLKAWNAASPEDKFSFFEKVAEPWYALGKERGAK